MAILTVQSSSSSLALGARGRRRAKAEHDELPDKKDDVDDIDATLAVLVVCFRLSGLSAAVSFPAFCFLDGRGSHSSSNQIRPTETIPAASKHLPCLVKKNCTA